MLQVLEGIIRDRETLDPALTQAYASERFAELEARDKAFARLVVMTVLRRHGELQHIIDAFLDKPLAAGAERARIILLAGTAELVLLGVQPHAAISLAVELTRLSRKTRHFDRMVNAILRRVAERGAEMLGANSDATVNFPEWMIGRWKAAYGAEKARRIAEHSLREAPLDLTLKGSLGDWPARLQATPVRAATLRRPAGGRIEDLPGYHEGAWWVQDAAATLPATILRPRPAERVLDLCAAPGGKTAQLCAAGAAVTAVDVSENRMGRLAANLRRLGLSAECIVADAADWQSDEPFDRILLDAPCSATGTIRRHPDILHLKRESDADRLGAIQQRLLGNAAKLLRVGGTLVYCSCSLEPEEGEARIAEFLASHTGFTRQPIAADEIGGEGGWLTPDGDLRTFPYQLQHDEPALSGMDGFYAARLVRQG